MNKYRIIRKTEEEIEVDANTVDDAVNNINKGIVVNKTNQNGEIVSVWKQVVMPIANRQIVD